MNLIKTYNQFILNETLKTTNIDITIRNIEYELSVLNYNFKIEVFKNNTFSVTIFDIDKTNNIDIRIDNLNSLCIDRHGWFPSKMTRINKAGFKIINKYNRDLLFKNFNIIKELTLVYEAKYDTFEYYSGDLYHLTIKQYIDNIKINGLVPKDSSKLTYHPSRIFVCKNIDYCKILINQIKILLIEDKLLNNKSNKNIEWCIFKISLDKEIKLYTDPNYSNGFYILDNINPNLLELIEEEIIEQNFK